MTTPMSCPPQALHLNIKTAAAAAAIARDAWMATSTKKATTSYNAASAIIQKHQNLLSKTGSNVVNAKISGIGSVRIHFHQGAKQTVAQNTSATLLNKTSNAHMEQYQEYDIYRNKKDMKKCSKQ